MAVKEHRQYIINYREDMTIIRRRLACEACYLLPTGYSAKNRHTRLILEPMFKAHSLQLECMRLRVQSLSLSLSLYFYVQSSGLIGEAPTNMCVSISRQRSTTVAHHFRPPLHNRYMEGSSNMYAARFPDPSPGTWISGHHPSLSRRIASTGGGNTMPHAPEMPSFPCIQTYILPRRTL